MRTLDSNEIDAVSGGSRGRILVLVYAGLVNMAMDAADKANAFWEGVKQGYKDGDAGDC